MKFPESTLAHKYLDGLKGIEIGGSAHNPFGLSTINVDNSNDPENVFKKAEREMCGEALAVDVVSPGDVLPFADKSFDFVISSHVIEHFWDPIKALREWQRVASKYIFIICPHVERTFDKGRPLTSISELVMRGRSPETEHPNDHHSVWDTQSFLSLCRFLDLNVVEWQDVDDKVGNGFAAVIGL